MSISSFSDFVINTASKKDIPLDTVTTQMQRPTGFMYLDYAAGSYVTVYDDDENPQYIYHNIGIVDGSLNTVISKSQGGKTTLCIRMAASIIEPWVNTVVMKKFLDPKLNPKFKDTITPVIQILDTEGTLGYDYVKKLVQYRNSWLQKHIMINPIQTDRELMTALDKHCKFKEQTMSKIYMPMNDLFGKPIWNYPPTVIIIDSMTNLNLDDVVDTSMGAWESQSQNTAGARRAKIISQITSKLNAIAKKYNVIIFSINHINIDPQMTAMPQPKQYRGLRQGEKLNGGERAIYLASSILRLDVIKSIGTEKSSMVNFGEGITGFISRATWIKCKSNSRGNAAQLVYTNEYGYDPLLSTLWQAKEMEHLPKTGNFFYLPELRDIRFTMKNARETFAEHPEMILSLYDNAMNWCEPFLDNADRAAMVDKKETKKYLEQGLREDIEDGTISIRDANELGAMYNDIFVA